MNQSAKNILISFCVGIIIFLILAIGYNLKIIPISINISNTIQSLQKQVDQLGIEFLGQIQIERSKMKDLAENSFIVDSFANQIITDKVYSEVYEYTIRNKNCYGITFVNNEKTIFFVYPPYASKRKGMVLASEYFNYFLTKEYSILPFQTSKELQSSDEIVLGYPVQKDGKILGLALFHYSGTSLLSEPVKRSSLSIKGFAFIKAYNMIVFNINKDILDQKDRLSDILMTIEEENRTIGPIKIKNLKYYFFSNQIGKSGKQVVVIPADKVGTPVVVQVVIAFYLITIIILITYVLLAFFFTKKEEEIDLKGRKFYQKEPELEQIKNIEEEEEFLSAVSSEEKKKDFFFEEVKSEKPIDTAFKSLVEEVSQKKSSLEVSLDEEYIFNPPETITTEELPKIPIEKKEETFELPDISGEEVVEEKDFEKKETGLPTLEELEESKEEYKDFEFVQSDELEIKDEKINLSEEELTINEKIKDKENETFELPEEVINISQEMKTLDQMEIPEIEQQQVEENIELPEISGELEQGYQPENESISIESRQEIADELEKNDKVDFESEEQKSKEIEELPDLENFNVPEEEISIEEKVHKPADSTFTELPVLEEISQDEGQEEFQIPEMNELEKTEQTLETPEEIETGISEEFHQLQEFEEIPVEEKIKFDETEARLETSELEEINEINESTFQEENLKPFENEFQIPAFEEEVKDKFQMPEMEEEISGAENIEEMEDKSRIPEIEGKQIFEKKDIETVESENEMEIPSIDELDREFPVEEIPPEISAEEDKMKDYLDIEPIGSITDEIEVEEKSSKKISDDESEFFADISSDEIALTAEELENVSKNVNQISENIEESETALDNIDEYETKINEKEQFFKPEQFEENTDQSQESNLEELTLPKETEMIEDLDLPKINIEDFNETDTKIKELPYDDLCKSFVAKYQVDAIAFFKSEQDVFTCAGCSDPGFTFIQFDADEPIIEKLSTLRKDIFIPEKVNKFEPLLSKNEELFSKLNSMYIHGIFDEGQLLGAIFIFSSAGNEKNKEEYYHISTKLAELIA